MAKKVVKKELAREIFIDVNSTTKVRVGITEFQGTFGLDVRKYVTTEKYTGYTKEGTRIPTEKIEDMLKAIETLLLTVKAENLYNATPEE